MKGMAKGKHIFRNYGALDDCREDRLTLAEKTEYKRIRGELLKIVKSNKSAIVAYSSPSGSGKSTIVRKLLSCKSFRDLVEIRTCEIWQYDNPDKVWEDFVLTTIAKNEESLSGLSKKAKYGQTKLHIVVLTIIVVILAAALRVLMEICIGEGILRMIILTLLDALVIASPIILSLINSSELVDSFDIDYRFQIEKVLLKELGKPGRPLFVVAEDIERSKTGIKLLESLHSFLSRNGAKLGRKLIVFTPTTKDFIYKKDGKEDRTQLERNLKIYDYIFEGWLRSKANNLDTETLFDTLGCKDEGLLELLNKLLENAQKDNSLTSLRAIQHMLREVDNFCYVHPGADSRITLLFVSTKYISYASRLGTDYVSSILHGKKVSPNISQAEGSIKLLKKVFEIEDDNRYGIKIKFVYTSGLSCVKDDAERLFKISVPRMYKYILVL